MTADVAPATAPVEESRQPIIEARGELVIPRQAIENRGIGHRPPKRNKAAYEARLPDWSRSWSDVQ